MDRIASYPKVYALGHPNIRDLFDGPVVIQEKIDGSQFSAGVVNGELKMRSRGAELYTDNPNKLFAGAIQTFQQFKDDGQLPEGVCWRGEVLSRPKHNALAYERVPRGNVILFDADTGPERRVDPEGLKLIGDSLDLEVVPTLFIGEVTGLDQLHTLLSSTSILGGPIEGIVIKNYARFNEKDGKMLMGKLVRPEYQELHQKEWRKANPSRGDIVQALITQLRNEARWMKAIQHLRDAGLLEHSPRDIGALIREIQDDMVEEESARIGEALLKYAMPQIRRGVTSGFPEWYKDQLAQSQFTALAEGA